MNEGTGRRPRVLITTGRSWRESPLRRWDVYTGRNYVDALTRVGLLPTLAPNVDPELAGELARGHDGVVFSGGADVDPRHFGQAPHPELEEIDASRDAFEFALYREARAAGLPVLAICRGLQLVNVAEGGTLHQHLPAVSGHHQHEQAERNGDPVHRVTLEGGPLRTAFGSRETYVSSFHHQGVDRLAEGLVAWAHADDGLVEAAGARTGAQLLAVQWHPEMSFARHPAQLAPFRAFAGMLGV